MLKTQSLELLLHTCLHACIGVFAASAFHPKDNVHLKEGQTINLASYAFRMNIQLLKAADFNSKLRERGCSRSITVQKACRIAKNENEVREVLDTLWENSSRSREIIASVLEKNKDLYMFEKILEAE